MISSLAAVAAAGLLTGCARSSTESTTAPSGSIIERNERNEVASSLRQEEAAETAKDRELLSELEAKQREEAAEVTAKRTEAKATAKAKKREKAAEVAAKHKEEAAEAAAKKREAASKSKPTNTPAATNKKTTTHTTPKESISTPPTVTVPNGSN